MSLKNFIGRDGSGAPVARGVTESDPPARDASAEIEDALKLVEREIKARYPMAGPFLGRYRDSARAILRLLHARWAGGGSR